MTAHLQQNSITETLEEWLNVQTVAYQWEAYEIFNTGTDQEEISTKPFIVTGGRADTLVHGLSLGLIGEIRINTAEIIATSKGKSYMIKGIE